MILLSISLKVSVRQPPTALFSLGPGTPGTPGTPLLESIIEGVLFLVALSVLISNFFRKLFHNFV